MARVECELMTQDAIDVEIAGKGVVLQDKSVDVEYNGTIVVAPDDGFDGLKSVEINTNVPKRFECGDAYFVPPKSGATSISIMGLLQKLDGSCWYTSSITRMDDMFNGCSSLQQLDVSGWDTSSVTRMGGMFNGCSSLQQLDVSGWDTSSVTRMDGMFNGCRSLQSLDVSKWDTSSVTMMVNMFNGCRSLQSLDVSKWDTSSVKDMLALFFGCRSLQSLDVSKWDTSSVTDMYATFGGLKLLKMLDFSGWDVSKARDLDRLLEDCPNIKTIIGDKTLQDVENGTVALRGTKVNIKTNYSPLRFSSILALANGLADLTGGTAETLTISANSYNNMYNDDDTKPTAEVISERQARIAAICAAKNWNFAH